MERFNVFEPLLYRRLKSVDEFFFVSIGANDGRMVDPVYWFIARNRYRVRGLLIEPMKDAFEELCRTYQDYPRLTPLNLAIHNTEKKMELYRVDPTRLKGLPAWSKGIASFNPEHHKLSGTPTERIITETVECVSLGELIEVHEIDTIDLLQIDTEGYDSEIILGLDFERVKPAVIHFKHGLAVGIMSRRRSLRLGAGSARTATAWPWREVTPPPIFWTFSCHDRPAAQPGPLRHWYGPRPLSLVQHRSDPPRPTPPH